MKELQFSIEINAGKEKVWDTLWNDDTFRDWANFIDEGTYMDGELVEGKDVRFISSVNGYGVTSRIAKLIPFHTVLFRHMVDTKERGTEVREDEWTGGTESYLLSETGGDTILTVKMDVPIEMEELFNERFPMALGRIKSLAETKEVE
ncbi:hypothetical protein [Youngiibacter fragilis]|uniref:ATPase n=1 Tax=Youngiibacter fragilis 232.1 TaxID=994573 RepID=V7I2H0_9CLOT|nr:hypothetical protein [Youngiibacter fragilis]ETA80063.1 hypothetical protein T472_0213850 [Youngiibacter fragilis 232.1]